MSLTKLLTDLANIQRLDDEPNDVGGLTSSELKETFDKAGIDIQGFINNTLIPELEAQFDETGLNTLAAAVEYANEKAAVTEQNANAYTSSAVSSAITTASADATAKANAAEQSAKNASIPVSQKGAVNGVASLDASGKVPSTQMPAMNYDPLGSAAAVQGNLNAHAGDAVKHVTAGERTTWNAKQNALNAGTDYATPAQVSSEAAARAAADSALSANKADKKVPAAAGNIAALDATGNIVDTGKRPGDFGIPDAPADGETYARKDNEWIALPRLRAFGVSVDLTNSNPETAVTYIDDAIGMNPGADWDTMPIFKDIKPCVLKAGAVQYYLNPNNFAQKADGTAADITSGNDGDVMIEIPKIGLAIATNGNTLTVKITNTPDIPSFKYYAHTRETEGDRDKLYVGAYLGFNSNGVLRSLSGKTPSASQNIETFRSQAEANGPGYDMVSFYPLTLLQCLYLLKFKNLNSQDALGRGFVDGNSAAVQTGGTNAKGMNFGETTGKQQMKFLGIEDFWGNLRWWIDGLYLDASWNIFTAFQSFNNSRENYTNRGPGATANISTYTSRPQGTAETGFVAKEGGGSATTYFSDLGILHAGQWPSFGGSWGNGANAGAFYLSVNNSASSSLAGQGARLMYL